MWEIGKKGENPTGNLLMHQMFKKKKKTIEMCCIQYTDK